MIYSKIVKSIAIFLIWLCFLLFSLEICLRTLGAFYSRNQSHLLKALDNVGAFRILCIGDSFTYGVGVKSSYTYPKQLEKMLSSNFNGSFKVFNLGVPGSNSSQHLRIIEEILDKYKEPNLIIILTGANDCWNFADSNIDKIINAKPSSALFKLKFKSIISKLQIYKLTKAILINLSNDPPGVKIDIFKQILKNENVNKDVLEKLLEFNLSQIIALARACGINVILQNYPRGDVYEGNFTQNLASKLNIPFVDNYSAFEKELGNKCYSELFVYDISHPNEYGYKIMAENLYKTIIKEGFIDKFYKKK